MRGLIIAILAGAIAVDAVMQFVLHRNRNLKADLDARERALMREIRGHDC